MTIAANAVAEASAMAAFNADYAKKEHLYAYFLQINT